MREYVAQRLLPDAELELEELVDLHTLLLERGDLREARLHSTLEHLYTKSSWLGRRVLLSRLGRDQHAVLPVLVKIAPAVDPTTRTAAIEAMGRMGHVAAEPYLIHVIEDGREGAAMISAARALAEFGTPASLQALRSAERFAGDRPTVNEAVQLTASAAAERILERFPMQAEQGGLTIAEERSVSGALTLTGASEGEVALYDMSQREVEDDRSSLARVEQSDALTFPMNDAFERLVPGPRGLPVTHYAEAFGHSGIAGAVLWVLAAGSMVIAASSMNVLLFSVLHCTLFLVLLASWLKTRRRRHILHEGISTYGQLEGVRTVPERPSEGEGIVEYVYTFKYMTEELDIETAERRFALPQPELEDDPFEPLLYRDGEVVLFDEFTNLQVSDEGQLTTNLARVAAYSILPLVYIGALITFMAQLLWVLL